MDSTTRAVATKYLRFASSASPDLMAQALAAKSALKSYTEFIKGKNREALGLNKALKVIDDQVDSKIEEINRVLRRFVEEMIKIKPSLGPLKDWDDSELYLRSEVYSECFIDPENLPYTGVQDQLSALRDALKEVRKKEANTYSQHYRVVCSSCSTLITQCRCRGPKETILAVCTDCKG